MSPPAGSLRALMLKWLIAIGLLAALGVFARTWPKQFVAVLILLMAASLISRMTSLRRAAARRTLRFVVWVSRRTRQSFGMSAEVEMMLLAGILLCMLLMAYMLLAQTVVQLSSIVLHTIGGSMALVGAIDLAQLVVRLLKTAWAKWIGKAAIAAVAAVSAWGAGVAASHVVSEVTMLDPKWFPDSKAALQLVATPLLSLLLCAGVIMVLATLAFAVMASVMGLVQTAQTLKSMLPFRTSAPSAKASISYRLAFGKNYPCGQRRPAVEWRPMAFLLRPLAIAAACGVLLDAASSAANLDSPIARRALSITIAAIDLHAAHHCAKPGPTARINYAPDGQVVLAEAGADGWKFSLGKCE